MNAPINAVNLLPAQNLAPGHRGTHVVKNQALGQLVGDEAVQELACLADRHLSERMTHDHYGNRMDWVEFHPSWHQLMALAT